MLGGRHARKEGLVPIRRKLSRTHTYLGSQWYAGWDFTRIIRSSYVKVNVGFDAYAATNLATAFT